MYVETEMLTIEISNTFSDISVKAYMYAHNRRFQYDY